MIVEVIAVGTELLLGEIVNTNAADIGVRMAQDGFDVHHQVIVGDNLERLVEAIRTACDRADAVVMTGGIGPTQDDMTRDAICEVLGVDLATDEQHAEAIRSRLAERGVVADTALRMADYPLGSDPMPNSTGVALGIAATFEDTPIFAVPGVPTEMRAMLDEQVRPRLRAVSGEPAVLTSRLLHCWGYGESQIAEQLDDLYASSNPSLAFLINGPEVRVRITAKATTAAKAEAMIAEVETIVRDRLGEAVFAVDSETIDSLLAATFSDRGWSVASVEVSTCGLLATRLASIDAFAGGVVLTADPGLEVLLADPPGPAADVLVLVGARSGQATPIAIRTPESELITAISSLGDDERARRFAVPGALHLLRTVI